MRRAIARGRVFPQSYSTDRRYGRLSLKACALFPLMWANADDQGRLPGDPEEIKYAVCPNIDHITKAEIPQLLEELDANQLIKLYNTSKTEAIQILDWWDVHRPQWAWPSQYSPPEGWQDHLRYKRSAKEVVTLNWPVSGEGQNGAHLSVNNSSGESSGETPPKPLLTTHWKEETEEERGRGNSPERSGERSPPPSLTTTEILNKLKQSYPYAFGKEPRARILAQLRDLATELSAAGCRLDYIDEAFGEAARQNKFSVSYVRAILLDWLGVARGPPR